MARAHACTYTHTNSEREGEKCTHAHTHARSHTQTERQRQRQRQRAHTRKQRERERERERESDRERERERERGAHTSKRAHARARTHTHTDSMTALAPPGTVRPRDTAAPLFPLDTASGAGEEGRREGESGRREGGEGRSVNCSVFTNPLTAPSPPAPALSATASMLTSFGSTGAKEGQESRLGIRGGRGSHAKGRDGGAFPGREEGAKCAHALSHGNPQVGSSARRQERETLSEREMLAWQRHSVARGGLQVSSRSARIGANKGQRAARSDTEREAGLVGGAGGGKRVGTVPTSADAETLGCVELDPDFLESLREFEMSIETMTAA